MFLSYFKFLKKLVFFPTLFWFSTQKSFFFFFFFFYFTLCISELAYSIQSSLDLSAMLLQILVTISIILGWFDPCWIVHSFLGLLLRHLLFSFACYYDNNNVSFSWLISVWFLVDEIMSYLSFVLFCFCVIHFITCMYFSAAGNQSLFVLLYSLSLSHVSFTKFSVLPGCRGKVRVCNYICFWSWTVIFIPILISFRLVNSSMLWLVLYLVFFFLSNFFILQLDVLYCCEENWIKYQKFVFGFQLGIPWSWYVSDLRFYKDLKILWKGKT